MPIPIYLFFICGVGLTYYLTQIFEFYQKLSHFGPLVSDTRRIVYLKRDEDGEVVDRYSQPVTLFEWVRRVFGVYTVEKEDCVENETFDIGCDEGEVWFVNQRRMELWECTTCLSGWMAVVPALLALVTYGIVGAILMWGVAAASSSILHVRMNKDGVSVHVYSDSDSESEDLDGADNI